MFRLCYTSPFAAWALLLCCTCVSRGQNLEPHEQRGGAETDRAFGRHTAIPRPFAGAELKAKSLQIDALLSAHGIKAPAMKPPLVRVDDFGAKGDGATDDTDAINRAVQSMEHGGTLIFTAGKVYLKRGLLEVGRPDVKLWGYGAKLYSVVTDDQFPIKGATRIAIHLAAPGTALYGLTIVSNLRGRPPGHPHSSGVWISSRDQEVIDNRLEYANIFARLAQNFVVARNLVYRATADGIHVTTGSSDGLVLGNLVRETGDDMIAVVNYGRGEPTIGNILIESNDLAGQYWGRGITVAGGRDVIIRKNRIAKSFGAAILVHAEAPYQTANVRRVRIEGNAISEVQTAEPKYNPKGRQSKPDHGAIDICGWPGGFQVSDVVIRDNSIAGGARDGIWVRGDSCDISIQRNRFSRIRRKPLRLEGTAAPACRVECSDNSSDGSPVSSVPCH